MNKCNDCKYRQYLARCFDVHIDWRDCPRAKGCERIKKENREARKIIRKTKPIDKYTYWMVFTGDGAKYVDLEVGIPTKLNRETISAVKKHIELQYGIKNAILLSAILLEE